MQFWRIIAVCCAALSLFCQAQSGLAATFPPKLFLSTDGVALSSFPNHQTLTRTIAVSRTQGDAPANWTASADQNWLSVTPSGSTGGSLTLAADPEGLVQNQFYQAIVTVKTDGADFTDTETVHVGLWIGAHRPGRVQLPRAAVSIAANPVSPLFYAANGGPNIFVYNVYSGELVSTFKTLGKSIQAMAMSSDGGTLFAADSAGGQIVAADAQSGAVLASYTAHVKAGYGLNLVYARPFGQPALYVAGTVSQGWIIAYPSGETLASGFAKGLLAVEPDGQKAYSLANAYNPSSLFAYSIKLEDGSLAIRRAGQNGTFDEGCRDITVSNAGTRVYIACASAGGFDVFDAETLAKVQTLPSKPVPDNVEVDWRDRVVGGLYLADPNDDVYVYRASGKLMKVLPPPRNNTGEQYATLKISGDGTRVITARQPEGSMPQRVYIRDLP